MTHRIWVGRPATAGAAAFFLAISVAFSACYTGDQSCAPAYDVNDVNDHCPYGSPGGPKAPAAENPCPEIAKLQKGTPDCQIGGKDINFTDNVYPLLSSPDKGACTIDGCHGTSAYKGGALKQFKTAQETMDVLGLYKGVIGAANPGRTYFNLDPAKSTKSWAACNLRGQAGALMPLGRPRMSTGEIAVIEQWLACGATPGAPAADVLPGTEGDGGDGAGGAGASAGDGGAGQGGAGQGGAP